MKICKRMAAMLLCLMVTVTFLPAAVEASGTFDPENPVTLTISCQDGDKALAGAQFDIYRVASVDEYGNPTPVEPFEHFNVDIRGKNDEAWKTLASTLEGMVLRDGISPDCSKKTDKNGMIFFGGSSAGSAASADSDFHGDGLAQGLYLVLGHRHTQDGYYYDASPFMVMLPGLDSSTGVWNYDVTVEAKYDSGPLPKEPETVTRKVLKVWKDEGHEQERPQEITVDLLRDGEIYDTVTLNADDNWRYSWSDLEAGYQWAIAEKTVENYTVEVVREGITFVVTNTCTGDTPETPGEEETTSEEPSAPSTPSSPSSPSKPAGSSGSKLPQTGQLWWPVPLMTAFGLLLIVSGLIRRRGIRHEKK